MAQATYVLVIFVTGETPSSRRQIEQLQDLLEREFTGLYRLSVVNVFKDPDAAVRHDVFATPTVVRLLPEPVRRIVDGLRDRERVLSGLELEHAVSADASRA